MQITADIQSNKQYSSHRGRRSYQLIINTIQYNLIQYNTIQYNTITLLIPDWEIILLQQQRVRKKHSVHNINTKQDIHTVYIQCNLYYEQ